MKFTGREIFSFEPNAGNQDGEKSDQEKYQVKLRRNSSSTIIPLNAVRWAGQLDQSQIAATPAAAKEINESEPVTQRWWRRENASTSMITTPAMLTIISGAIKDRLTSGLVAWNKSILIQWPAALEYRL
jgi:hypothetical protein